MTLVTNMVCPYCARTHGREHVQDCPRIYDGNAGGVYAKGWNAGRTDLLRVVGEMVEHAHDRRDEAQALAAMFLVLWARDRSGT